MAMVPRFLHLKASARVLVALVTGLLAAVVAALFAPWQVAVLAGWAGTALFIVGFFVLVLLRKDCDETAALARREDDSRFLADLTLLSASGVSLVTIGFGLIKAGQEHGGAKVLMTAMCVLSVFLSWAVVQVVFTLHYARLWYSPPHGGIDFNEEENPDFKDFAYVAVTIGMTYQVSDTNLQKKVVRRTATRHALLSYLFGTVVVAVMINVVASLLR
jgi:uncharacterized membrane protein